MADHDEQTICLASRQFLIRELDIDLLEMAQSVLVLCPMVRMGYMTLDKAGADNTVLQLLDNTRHLVVRTRLLIAKRICVTGMQSFL